MWYPVLGFFQLILKILSKLIPDVVNQSLKIPKVFFKEGFELESYKKNDALVVALVMSSSEANSAIKEKGYK